MLFCGDAVFEMTALDALRAVDDNAAVRQLSRALSRFKRATKPFTPFITRALLVLAFVEDAIHTLVEYKSQLQFFQRELWIPRYVALILILGSTAATLVGSAMLFFSKFEKRGAKLLLAATVYQQLIYGRHSPITSGNVGFLIRNLCLCGTLLLLMSARRVRDGLPALPGLPETRDKRQSQRHQVALVTRILMALLSVEMFDVIGWGWATVICPIAVALVLGYKTDLMGALLMAFYVLATVSSKQFWRIDASAHVYMAFKRDVMRFEFLQTVSILSGLLLLISTGPGALSLDDTMRRTKAW